MESEKAVYNTGAHEILVYSLFIKIIATSVALHRTPDSECARTCDNSVTSSPKEELEERFKNSFTSLDLPTNQVTICAVTK
jgi:hypothetical protein